MDILASSLMPFEDFRNLPIVEHVDEETRTFFASQLGEEFEIRGHWSESEHDLIATGGTDYVVSRRFKNQI
jgi:hypothetical protein